MYYSFSCPKCGILLSEFEGDAEASWDANYKLEDMVKQHYAQMHTEGEQVMTDSELLYAIKTGMKSSEEKPY
jgi:hypothetical protein